MAMFTPALGPNGDCCLVPNGDCCPPLSRRATIPIGNQATIPIGALGRCEHGLIVFRYVFNGNFELIPEYQENQEKIYYRQEVEAEQRSKRD